MKKVLSLVLVIAMVLSSMSFAFAGTFEDVTGDYEDAINTLVGLGVVTGYEDGTFRPEKTITRAEMAKLMVITLGYGDLVAGSKSNFADTQGHWADAYIALAAGKGIVLGDGNGNFRPDATVSYNEAITMIVRGLGYTDASNELKGMSWPTNFKVKAAELDITDDVVMNTTGADRGGVAQLLFNALEAALVTVNSDGDVVKATTTEVEDGKVVTVYVQLLSRLAEKKNIAQVLPKHVDEDDDAYYGDIVDLGQYMYQDIDVYVNDDGDVVYVSDVNSDVKVGEFRKTVDANGVVVSNDNKVNIRIDGKNKAYTVDFDGGVIPVYYNGVAVNMDEVDMEVGTTDIVNLHRAAATFVMNDDDQITAIVATKLTEAARVTNEYNGRTKIQGFALPLNDDDEVDYDKLTVTGVVDSLEDIEEDDVIVLFAGAGEKTTSADTEKLVIEVVRESVEGKITKSNTDGQFYINDKFYSVSEFKDYSFAVGEEGTYYLDHQGKLVDFVEDDSDAPEDYAVITEVLDGVFTGGRIIADAEITVINAAGEEVTYEFADKAKVDTAYVFDLRETTDMTVVDEQTDVDVNTVLSKYDIIQYSLNSSGKISEIEMINNNPSTATPASKTDITTAAYEFASNVVVFNLDGTDVEVADYASLGDKVYILATEENKNGEIEMIFVKGLGTTKTYAYITAEGTMWNDDDKEVQSLTAYVDGVEVFYEADALNAVSSNYVDTATIVELDLDGNIVEGIVGSAYPATTPSALVVDTVSRVSDNRFRVGTGTNADPYVWYTLADDAVVYILDDGEFDSVGDVSSVYYDASVAGFRFDADNITDNVNVIDILFIFE
jgi:hypothetical protein